MQGKIIRGIGGLYYVDVRPGDGPSEVYECKARGSFRRERIKPLVGDDVEIEALDGARRQGVITDIMPRRSVLVRPAVANVDQALVIFSVLRPKPSFNLLDRFLIMMGQQELPCIICFNKEDIDVAGEGRSFCETYRQCGYRSLTVSAEKGSGMDELRGLLTGKTTVTAGPSGVGKSSIVNRLQTGVRMETGNISEKIQRGKHTTRRTELIPMGGNTFIMDTPGFSSLELFDMTKERLAGFFPEFSRYEKDCRFVGCAHIKETECGVRGAVSRGEVSRLRYDNYCLLYEELKEREKYK